MINDAVATPTYFQFFLDNILIIIVSSLVQVRVGCLGVVQMLCGRLGKSLTHSLGKLGVVWLVCLVSNPRGSRREPLRGPGL